MRPQSRLYPSEIVASGLPRARQEDGERAFRRRAESNLPPPSPQRLERTRPPGRSAARQERADRFSASPTVSGISGGPGEEANPPRREGRSPSRIGGVSNRRWITGGEPAVILNPWGESAAWNGSAANGYDAVFPPRIEPLDRRRVALADDRFRPEDGGPPSLMICKRNARNRRRGAEIFLSIHRARQARRPADRMRKRFHARPAFGAVLCNLLASRNGLVPAGRPAPLPVARFDLSQRPLSANTPTRRKESDSGC
jgi:hypothetical protein